MIGLVKHFSCSRSTIGAMGFYRCAIAAMLRYGNREFVRILFNIFYLLNFYFTSFIAFYINRVTQKLHTCYSSLEKQKDLIYSRGKDILIISQTYRFKEVNELWSRIQAFRISFSSTYPRLALARCIQISRKLNVLDH